MKSSMRKWVSKITNFSVISSGKELYKPFLDTTASKLVENTKAFE